MLAILGGELQEESGTAFAIHLSGMFSAENTRASLVALLVIAVATFALPSSSWAAPGGDPIQLELFGDDDDASDSFEGADRADGVFMDIGGKPNAGEARQINDDDDASEQEQQWREVLKQFEAEEPKYNKARRTYYFNASRTYHAKKSTLVTMAYPKADLQSVTKSLQKKGGAVVSFTPSDSGDEFEITAILPDEMVSFHLADEAVERDVEDVLLGDDSGRIEFSVVFENPNLASTELGAEPDGTWTTFVTIKEYRALFGQDGTLMEKSVRKLIAGRSLSRFSRLFFKKIPSFREGATYLALPEVLPLLTRVKMLPRLLWSKARSERRVAKKRAKTASDSELAPFSYKIAAREVADLALRADRIESKVVRQYIREVDRVTSKRTRDEAERSKGLLARFSEARGAKAKARKRRDSRLKKTRTILGRRARMLAEDSAANKRFRDEAASRRRNPDYLRDFVRPRTPMRQQSRFGNAIDRARSKFKPRRSARR